MSNNVVLFLQHLYIFFCLTVELTTAVFPYQHTRTSMSTIPSSLSTTSGSQVESTVEELSFPTTNSLSSTIMSTITASSKRMTTAPERMTTSPERMTTSPQRMITSPQRIITSLQRLITSSQNIITSTQNMATSSQNVDLTHAVDDNSTFFNQSSTNTVTSSAGISTSSEKNPRLVSEHYMTTLQEIHHGFTDSSTALFDKTIKSSTLGSDTSIIDNQYSVTPEKDSSPTINRTNNSTEVTSTGKLLY